MSDPLLPLHQLQLLDTSADDLLAKRAGLPQRAARKACAAAAAEIDGEREAARVRHEALNREERSVEAELAELQEKSSAVEKSLYSGKSAALKELEALQAELDALTQKRSEFEDQGMVLLEQIDELEALGVALSARRAAVDAEDEALAMAIASAESEIDAELAELRVARTDAAGRIPPAILPVYEKLRERPKLGGRVTAELDKSTCGACKVTLPVMDATRARSDGAEVAVQCPACTRILVVGTPG